VGPAGGTVIAWRPGQTTRTSRFPSVAIEHIFAVGNERFASNESLGLLYQIHLGGDATAVPLKNPLATGGVTDSVDYGAEQVIVGTARAVFWLSMEDPSVTSPFQEFWDRDAASMTCATLEPSFTRRPSTRWASSFSNAADGWCKSSPARSTIGCRRSAVWRMRPMACCGRCSTTPWCGCSSVADLRFRTSAREFDELC